MSLIRKAEKLYYIARDIYERLIELMGKVNTNFVESLSGLAELIVEADIALGCKFGYAGVKWFSAEEIERRQPWNKRILGIPLTESVINISSFIASELKFEMEFIIDLVDEAPIAEKYESYKRIINKEIEERRKKLCEMVETLAYEVAAVHCVLMGYLGGSVKMGKLRCVGREE